MALAGSDLPPLSVKRRGRAPITNCKLAIRYLPLGITRDELFAKFKQYGPIQSVVILPPSRLGARYSFGFVEYSNHMSACTAKLELDHTNWRDCMIAVEWALPRERAAAHSGTVGAVSTIKDEAISCNVESTVVQVKNIPITMTERLFHQLFSKCGKIRASYMLVLPPNASPPQAFSGFVQFSKVEEANKAIQDLNGKMLHGSHITVQASHLFSGSPSTMPSMPAETHPNRPTRKRPLCLCPPTVHPSIPVNVLDDFGAMKSGCPPFVSESLGAGVGEKREDGGVVCTATSPDGGCGLGILAMSQECAGESPLDVARGSFGVVDGEAAMPSSSVDTSSECSDATESTLPALYQSTPIHLIQTTCSPSHLIQATCSPSHLLQATCSPSHHLQATCSPSHHLQATCSPSHHLQATCSPSHHLQATCSPSHHLQATCSPSHHLQATCSPSHFQATCKSFLSTHRGRTLAKVLGNLQGQTGGKPQVAASALCPASPASPVHALLPSSAECGVSPVHALLPSSAECGVSPVHALLPSSAECGVSPVHALLPSSAECGVSPVHALLPSSAECGVSPVHALLPSSAECGVSPVQATIPLYYPSQQPPRAPQSLVYPNIPEPPSQSLVYPNIPEQSLQPLSKSPTCHPSWVPPPLPPPSLFPSTSTSTLSSKDLSRTPPSLLPQGSLLQSAPCTSEVLGHPCESKDESSLVDVRGGDDEKTAFSEKLLSSAHQDLFIPQVESPDLRMTSEVRVKSPDLFSTPMEPLGLHSTEVDTSLLTAQLSAQVECPGLPTQLECPGLSTQLECPGPITRGHTTEAELSSLFTTSAMSMDMRANVHLSPPPVGSSFGAVSVSMTTAVAKKRKAVRLAAVFSSTVKTDSAPVRCQEEGALPLRCQEEGALPVRCQEEGALSVRCQEEGALSVRCQEEGALSVRCQEEGALPVRCQEEGALSVRCQEEGALLVRCQEEGALPVRCQEEGALPVRCQEEGAKSVHTALPDSKMDCNISVDPLVLTKSFLETSLESDADSSICLSNVPDPSLGAHSSCESSLCLSVGLSPLSLQLSQEDGPSGSFGACQLQQPLEVYTSVEVESATCGRSQLDNGPTSALSAPPTSELFAPSLPVPSCDVLSLSQLSQSSLSEDHPDVVRGSSIDVQFSTEELLSPPRAEAALPVPTLECPDPLPLVPTWECPDPLPVPTLECPDSLPLVPTLECSDSICIPNEPIPLLLHPLKDEGSHGDVAGGSAASISELKRAVLKLQADVDKASHKTRKASEQIEAEMAALDHEKIEPRLPLGIQLERVGMYDRIIHLHAQWVFENERVRHREEEEKVALRGAENKWGKDSNSYLEFKLHQQVDTLKAQLFALQLLGNELQLKEEFYAV